VAIAHALTNALDLLESTDAIEDIVCSDEFVAAVTRAQRAAAETSNQQKRQRLAAVVPLKVV
jgi:hypothetical protein